MRIEHGQPFAGQVKTIIEAGELAEVPVARVSVRDSDIDSLFPLRPDHLLRPGDPVIITPHIKNHLNGGSLTTFSIEKSPRR